MKKRTTLLISLASIVVLTLGLAIGAFAQSQTAKPYAEGEAGSAGSNETQSTGYETKNYAEGEAANRAGSNVSSDGPERPPEGQAGNAGRMYGDRLNTIGPSLNGLVLLYRFTGVSDDGEQGSANREEATSIHCTNIDPLNNNQVEVQVFQWNGSDIYTGTLVLSPNRTSTFSTQNTSIYFEDVVLGGNPGTDAIFQGSGQVWGSTDKVICSAQVLDPFAVPPNFAVSLELYQE